MFTLTNGAMVDFTKEQFFALPETEVTREGTFAAQVWFCDECPYFVCVDKPARQSSCPRHGYNHTFWANAYDFGGVLKRWQPSFD